MGEQKTFEEWAIIELFGHQRIAGRVSEQVIGGCSFVRVDVPAINNTPAFTKMFGNGAIYAITICDEQAARMAARGCQQEPLAAWTVQHLINTLPAVETGREEDDDVQT
jgi:hypothetical protein